MLLFLGIDGGQSSTTAVIGDESGRVLGSGRGGPCNHVEAAGGREKLLEAIGGCLQGACSEASLDRDSVTFEAVCAGFSGGPSDKEALLRELLRAGSFTITTDAVIALAGATAGQPGIITVGGTGSISYGRNADRKFARAGGWGYIFGDEGGGFDIARQALRAILRHEEGWGPPTSLRKALLVESNAKDANELLHRFYTDEYSRPHIASLSKTVDEAANDGDAVARTILLNAGQQLATATAAVRRQLFTMGAPARVSPVGGVFRSRLLSDRFRTLVELQDGNAVSEPEFGPATGALIEAYASRGLAPKIMDAPQEKYG